MFDLCTFSFPNLSAADTEVHLMKTRGYFYLCSRACVCTASCLQLVTEQSGPSMNNKVSGRGAAERGPMKVEGCISVSSSVSVCFIITMLLSVVTSNAAVHPPGLWGWGWGGGVFTNPCGNFLPVANTHLFYVHQQWRNPKSTSVSNSPPSMHHHHRLQGIRSRHRREYLCYCLIITSWV